MQQHLEKYIASLRSADEQLVELVNVGKKFCDNYMMNFELPSVWDRSLNCLFLSKIEAGYFNVKAEDVYGKSCTDVGITMGRRLEDIICFEGGLQHVVSTGKALEFETSVPIFTNIGSKYFHCNLNPIFDYDGEVIAVAVRIRDITEEKLSEPAFSNQVAKFNQLFDLYPFPVMMLDNEGVITAVNKAHKKIMELSDMPSFLGKPGMYFANAVGFNWENSPMRKALAGQEILNYCIEAKGKAYLINAVPLWDYTNNKILGAMSMINDITEYEKLKEELARLDRLNLVGEMAAGLAHEIRNPMTVIKGYLQYLEKKATDNTADKFSTALGELERVEKIIADFLSLARNKPVEYKEQDLSCVVEEITPLLNTWALAEGINLKITLATEQAKLRLDDKEIKQLILNLARNGMEAMNHHGTLKIETGKTKEKVYLKISDNGCGIPPEIQGKLFKPFFTTKENGTGLGLPICAGIVQRHNGLIEVQSIEGIGTTLNIYFPIAN